MVSPAGSEQEKRDRLCRKLGLGNTKQVYDLVLEGARRGPDLLMRKGLNASTLPRLGYASSALKRLGYSPPALEKLGFGPAQGSASPLTARERAATRRSQSTEEGATFSDELKSLIEQGLRAEQLLSRGFNVVLCKKAGYSAAELNSLGFGLHELRSTYSLAELRRAGFNATDLKRFYHGSEFLQAGFSGTEMRLAGFTARQLLSFGYNENAVTTAGYTIVELTEAGLSKRTVDRRGFQ